MRNIKILSRKSSQFLLILFCSALGQGSFFIASPIIAHLYTPDDFSIYSVYSVCFSTLSVAIMLRYELVIPAAKTHKVAVHLLLLCIFILVFFTSVIGLFLITCNLFFYPVVYFKEFPSYLYYLIPGFILYGFYRVCTYWMIRQQRYQLIAYTKLSQGLSQVVITVFFGYWFQSPIGLIVGMIVGYSAGISRYLVTFIKKDRQLFRDFNFGLLKSSFLKFKGCYKYSTLSSLLDTLNASLPTLLIIAMFGPTMGGQYSFALILIATPLGIFSQTLGQIFYGEISACLRNEAAKLMPYYIKSIVFIFMLTALPAIIAFFFIPDLFLLLFQKKWIISSELSRYILLQSWVAFCVISVSQYYSLLQKQHLDLLWNVFRLLLLSMGFSIEIYFKISLLSFIEVLTMIQIIIYISLFLLNVYCIKKVNLSSIFFDNEINPCAY